VKPRLSVRAQRRGRSGQATVELALILVLVAVVVLTTMTVMGNQLVLTYQDIQEAILNPDDPGSTTAYTCPGGGTAVLHGHKYHCQ
jgi:Flp pilus assembly pilin Flp